MAEGIIIRRGIAPAAIEYITATGGSISDVNIGGVNFRIHAFTSTGTSTFNVSNLGSIDGTVDYLIVAGGGAGGNCQANSGLPGSGGGAGGFVSGNLTITTQSYQVAVGAGGAGTTQSNISGSTGNNSSVFGVIALGGGAGGGDSVSSPCAIGTSENQRRRGCVGGSSGGSGVGVQTSSRPLALQPSSASGGFGNNGGIGDGSPNSGGGGGADGAGGNDVGTGGSGRMSDITGVSVAYAGGGGGGGNIDNSGYSGGIGGGGRGQNYKETSGTIVAASNGTDGLGGGGGGTPANQGQTVQSGNGGSGIVIIRYEIAPSA